MAAVQPPTPAIATMSGPQGFVCRLLLVVAMHCSPIVWWWLFLLLYVAQRTLLVDKRLERGRQDTGMLESFRRNQFRPETVITFWSNYDILCDEESRPHGSPSHGWRRCAKLAGCIHDIAPAIKWVDWQSINTKRSNMDEWFQERLVWR